MLQKVDHADAVKALRTDPGKYARKQMRDRLKTVRREARAVETCPCDAEAVHDLRVAIRKLEQAREVFYDIFVDSRKLKFKGVKKVMKLCGRVRSHDVAAALLEEMNIKLPRALRDELGKRKLRAQGRLKDAIGDYRISRQMKRGRRRARYDADSDFLVNAALQRYIGAMREQFFEAGSDVAGHESRLVDMHKFRILAKRLRYSFELFEDTGDDACNHNGGRLKKIQDSLGAVNDCVTTRDLLRGLEHPVDHMIITMLGRLQHSRFLEFQKIWRRDFADRGSIRLIEW